MAAIGPSLLACTVDPMAAKVQGLPVRVIGLLFSIITAASAVVSMVQVIGALLVTALLVTPAATAQQIGKSFKSCIIWTQFFGISSLFIGLYFSAEEMGGGSGSMIALVAAIIFAIVVITKSTYKFFTSANNA